MAEIPMARGLFVCEQVIVDHHTRNASLINCFSGWPIDRFPSPPQRFSVYAALTNGSGNWMMKVSILRLKDLTTIYERLMPHHFPSPMELIRFHFRVKECIFPAPGDYVVQLYARNDFICDTVLKIDSTEKEHG